MESPADGANEECEGDGEKEDFSKCTMDNNNINTNDSNTDSDPSPRVEVRVSDVRMLLHMGVELAAPGARSPSASVAMPDRMHVTVNAVAQCEGDHRLQRRYWRLARSSVSIAARKTLRLSRAPRAVRRTTCAVLFSNDGACLLDSPELLDRPAASVFVFDSRRDPTARPPHWLMGLPDTPVVEFTSGDCDGDKAGL